MRLAHPLLALAFLTAACGADDDPATVTDTPAASTDDSTAESATVDTPAEADDDAATESAPDEEDPMTTTTSGAPDDDAEPTATTEPPSTTLQLNPTTTKAVPTTVVPGPLGGSSAEFPGQIEPALAGFVDLAIADLAERIDADATSITLVSSVLVTWPDGAIGCPLPDMVYIQVPQDGALIELEHAGSVYRYHSGGDQTSPFLCPAGRATSPA